jgi:phage-related baseplate assembly protein
MDSSEVHYLTYDPEKIWETMILNYVEAGGDILYPGDEKEMLLRSVQADIVQIFAGVDNALRMQTLRYAQGEYLDILGELRGCERIDASAATATVTITTNATGKADVIEAGTAMTGDGELYYLLQEDLELTGYQQTVTVGIVAERTGSAGNGLRAGKEMTLAVTNSGVSKIVVATDAAGGNEEEEDDAYRTRIREYGLASITTGPEQQYEAVAEDTSSDIIDAKALNLGAGKVGVYIILQDSSGSPDTVARDVLNALSATNIRPLTDEVAVYRATDVPYTLNVKYSADNSSATSTAIAKAVKEYQEWQDNTIGRAFNPDRLMAALYQAGATRVFWGIGSVFRDAGEVTYTEIEANERCKGTITLETITT